MPSLRAMVIITGIIITTTGVLFKNAEAAAISAKMITSVTIGRLSIWASACRVSQSRAPVRTRPPMIRNIMMIVQGAVLDSTLTASS